jgi:Uri superfamily endonuclease
MKEGSPVQLEGRRISYQIVFEIGEPLVVRVGALGVQRLEPGLYVYTGSAVRGLEARIRRHVQRSGRLRWHIDYVLRCEEAKIVEVRCSSLPECRLNRESVGTIPIPGFGASDCRSGCGSHLKRIECRRSIGACEGGMSCGLVG